MDMDFLSPGLVFIATALCIIIVINLGYVIGSKVYKRSHAEKESPTSAISSTVLGLLAFILAFTFGVVTNRFDTRRELTREDANAIRNAWLRSAFLPEKDQIQARALIKEYVDIRIAGVQSNKLEEITNTNISIFGKTISILGKYDDVDLCSNAVNKLIDGQKHGIVYSFIQKKKRLVI